LCEFYPGYSENLLQIPAGKYNPCKKLKMMEQQSGGGRGGEQESGLPYITSPHGGNNGYKKSGFISTCLCFFENLEYINNLSKKNLK
jgi:hypothetical protein